MVNMESFRKIAHCWIDQAIINSLEDDLGTNGEINMKQAIEVFEEHNPEPFAKFGIGHDIGLAKVMFRW